MERVKLSLKLIFNLHNTVLYQSFKKQAGKAFKPVLKKILITVQLIK